MELHGSTRPSINHFFGGEREQMLNLNQRLETYLNRVKLLDEENAKLAEEIRALRRNHHGNLERRKILDDELRNARMEVDGMWRERVCAEADVARLTDELQGLEIQLRTENQAQVEAKAKADQSRRELEEERRAQIWLREKVNQLEQEMKSLILSHQEEVGYMEAMLMQPRSVRPSAASVQHGPNLLELGQEYAQRAERAWHEAAQAYKTQLARLEESVDETRRKLALVNKEKSEGVLKLQNLDRELLGLEDLREHLESTADQQRESHCRDVQMLQEHLEDLEREKQALAHKMEQLLLENRGLLQMKMSLNMEVATYRALLDNENLTGDISFQKQPRNIYNKDAVFSPWGAKDNYHMSPSPKTPPTSLVRSMSGRTKPQAIIATPTLYQKYVPRKEILEISKEKSEDKRVYQQLDLTPYPKVLKNGAIENFRPQEVHEKVTYAEPLSPPDEQEAQNGDFWNDTVDQPHKETPCAESQVSNQVEPSLHSEAPLEETSQLLVEPALIEQFSSSSIKSELLEMQNEKEYFEHPQATTHSRFDNEWVTKSEQQSVESNLSYQVESASNPEEPIKEATPELAGETYADSCTGKTDMQDIPIGNEGNEKPQVPTDAWAEMKYDNKTDQPSVESNSHQVESVPNTEEPIESNTELVRDPFTVDSYTVAVKSEMKETHLKNEEIEKPQAPIDARAEMQYADRTEQLRVESNNSHQVETELNTEEPINVSNLEVVGEPFTVDFCTVAVKSELQEKPFENEEIEMPQASIDAWAEMKYVNKAEQLCEESNPSHQGESVSKTEDSFNEITQELIEEPLIDEPCTIAVSSELQKVPSEIEKPQAPIGAWTERESIEDTKDMPQQQESSDSETEAFVELDFDTKSSSPASEESLKNQLSDIVKEDFTFDSVGVSKDDVTPPKEKLYPDGEEMDTWDSVIEQNQDVNAENIEEPEEATRQHAEPEEDISARDTQLQQQQQDMIHNIEVGAKIESQIDHKQQNNLTEDDNPDKSQDDEQEDSQNVSVSWRTELEGDSYAQDNTLADTRPLIRYKSDDTDANTQASHVDDVDDSSDSEQDNKVGEMVSGMWIEDKTRKFGTMEDLCEEAEGGVLDEEYDFEYLRKDGKDDDSQEEEIKTVVEQELDTDKLVEQELENLKTECYTTHFAQHQSSTKDTSLQESVSEQPKAWKEALQDTPESLGMEDFLTSEEQGEQKEDELLELLKTDEEEDQELVENEGEKHDMSTVTHIATTEDATEVEKEAVWSSTSQELSFDNASIEQKKLENMEEQLEEQEKQLIAKELKTGHESQSVVDYAEDDINQSDEPISTKPEMHSDNGVEIRDTTPEEMFVPEEADKEFPKVMSTTEWEVENPMETVGCNESKTATDLAQRGLSSDDKVENCSLSPTEEPLNTSPESVHEEADLFIVKDSKSLLKTNGKENRHSLFSIGGNDDFWMSPLETGATYQPDNVDTKHVEWKIDFGDVEGRVSDNLDSKPDVSFGQKEFTQIKTVVKGEIVHSEESEDDSDAMSSGEE